jgi:hypothetical protein
LEAFARQSYWGCGALGLGSALDRTTGIGAVVTMERVAANASAPASGASARASTTSPGKSAAWLERLDWPELFAIALALAIALAALGFWWKRMLSRL